MTYLNQAFVTLALLVLLSACQASSTSAGQNAGEVSQPQESASIPASNASASKSDRDDHDAEIALAGELKKGMAYADLSALAQAGGWIPSPDEKCNANVVGSNYQALCEKNPDLASCHVCEEIPELSSCSGDGYCGMLFHNAKDSQLLEVSTNGMIEDWNVSGSQSRLQVIDWKMKK